MAIFGLKFEFLITICPNFAPVKRFLEFLRDLGLESTEIFSVFAKNGNFWAEI